MVRNISIAALVGALFVAGPASATILTLPFVGDIEHPDFDPFHVLMPAPAPEPAPAPVATPMKHHHHHKKKM